MTTKKELKNRYKNRVVIGGIYCITCKGNGRTWIKTTRDMRSQLSQFQFAMSTNSCPQPGMYEEWSKYGAEAFSFTVLEEIQKGEKQTDSEFLEDIHTLLEMWHEKQEQGSVEG
jgi:hypothetical protein